MFVRRLVTGVRSSCEASATSWRCGDSSAAPSSVEHRVEARRQPADLVVAAASIRRPRSSVADVLGGLGQLGHRRDHRRENSAPERGRERGAADASTSSSQRSCASVASTPSRLRASWTAPPPGIGTVSTRTCSPAIVRSSTWLSALPAATALVARRHRDLGRRGVAGPSTAPSGSSTCTYGAAPPARGGSAGRQNRSAVAQLGHRRRRAAPRARPGAERLVDLLAQLVAHHEVADDRAEHDGDADGAGGEQRQAAAQRHQPSRST